MFIRVLDCVTADHSRTLVILAICVAFLSGFTLFSVVDHVRARCGYARLAWGIIGAFVAGAGIWSTHFIAMLGFHPAAFVSYDVGMTAISALLAIGFAGIALPLLLSSSPLSAFGGSLVLGASIGVMHFSGMKAMIFAGVLNWDKGMVAASLGVGAALVTLATFLERQRKSFWYRAAAGIVFGSAICSLHFIAMTAAVLKTNPTVSVPEGGLSEHHLGIFVALVTSIIVLFSSITIILDRRAYEAATETRKLRSILQATQTGIVVCQDDTIICANSAFERLVGFDLSGLEGRSLSDFIEMPIDEANSSSAPFNVEAELRTAGGTTVDISLHMAALFDVPQWRLFEMRDIRDQKQSREHMLHLASHDALTDLPNRRLLMRELKAEENSGHAFSLLWIDLDHFKEVNDTHGHAIGDAVLCEVAIRLRSALDRRHVLARVGGDEFVVLYRPGSSQADPVRAAEGLLKAFIKPILVEAKPINVGMSVGLASYPQDADSVDALWRRADLALYDAKKQGRRRLAKTA